MAYGKQPEIALDCRNWLGESIIWDDGASALYWVDIHAKSIWRWEPFGATAPRVFTLLERPGALGLRRDGGLVLGLESGFALFDESSGAIDKIADVEADLPTTRLNDGRVDIAGRFLCGGMDEAENQQAISALYVLEPDRTVRRLLNGIACANSTCWSADGRTLYFSNMPTRRIDAFDYDIENGTVSNRRPFVSFDKELGLPDGSAVDAEGCLWNAEWGGGKLLRFRPNGQLDREVLLPVTNPTCVAFGGPDLDTLFVTTAWFGLTDEQRNAEPLAGSLFAFAPGVRGRPENRYAG